MFTRGMWIGYGEVPKEQDGITLSLRESFPQEVYKSRTTEAGTADVEVLEGQDPKAFGSLLKVCGFGTTNTKNTISNIFQRKFQNFILNQNLSGGVSPL